MPSKPAPTTPTMPATVIPVPASFTCKMKGREGGGKKKYKRRYEKKRGRRRQIIVVFKQQFFENDSKVKHLRLISFYI